MKKPKIAKGPWESTSMKGKPGHCFLAQLFDNDGQNIISIDSRYKKKKATDTAKAIELAVNNTYHKNVDPEGIEQLIKAAVQTVMIMGKNGKLLRQALKNIYFENSSSNKHNSNSNKTIK